MAFDDIGRRNYKLPFIIFSLILLAALSVAGYYFFTQRNGEQNLFGAQTNVKPEEEAKQLAAEVGKLYELPQGEDPTVATVSDVKKLEGQEFFKPAQNGDKVLIFAKAKKAILYRPSTKKIINVGPINIDDNAQANNSASSSANTSEANSTLTPTKEALRVAIYNGTSTTGLARRFEQDKLTALADKFEAVMFENANREAEYEKSVVVDLSGKNKQSAAELAKLAGGSVASLPDGEERPSGADIMVILGKSYSDN